MTTKNDCKKCPALDKAEKRLIDERILSNHLIERLRIQNRQLIKEKDTANRIAASDFFKDNKETQRLARKKHKLLGILKRINKKATKGLEEYDDAGIVSHNLRSYLEEIQKISDVEPDIHYN